MSWRADLHRVCEVLVFPSISTIRLTVQIFHLSVRWTAENRLISSEGSFVSRQLCLPFVTYRILRRKERKHGRRWMYKILWRKTHRRQQYKYRTWRKTVWWIGFRGWATSKNYFPSFQQALLFHLEGISMWSCIYYIDLFQVTLSLPQKCVLVPPIFVYKY